MNSFGTFILTLHWFGLWHVSFYIIVPSRMMGGCLLSLAFVGLVICLTMILTIPKIKRVNLDAAIRFMWILYWVLPIEILFVIALFDYHRVTGVWIKHWWSTPSMAFFRHLCCEDGTANTKCSVPIKGGHDFSSEEDWCKANYDGARKYIGPKAKSEATTTRWQLHPRTNGHRRWGKHGTITNASSASISLQDGNT